MPVRCRALSVLSLLVAVAAEAQDDSGAGATLLISTRSPGAIVRIDGQDRGATPAALQIALPDGQPRTILIEVGFEGKATRRFELLLGPGESVALTNLALPDSAPGGGQPEAEHIRPQPTPLEPPPTEFPPPGWPAYLPRVAPPAQARVRVSPRDGMPQALVPAGQFTMGSTDAQVEQAFRMCSLTGNAVREWFLAEQPPRRVFVSAFWMDLHEVTCDQYCRFLNDSRPPDHVRRKWVAVRGEGDAVFRSNIVLKNGVYRPLEKAELMPVSHVSWDGATAYAQWAGRQLPSEAQWERACRAGAEGRFFAWPDEAPPAGAGNLCDLSHVGRWRQIKKPGRYFLGYDDGYPAAAPVCSFQPNAFGLYDLVGNLWEWCLDYFDPNWYGTMPARDPVNTHLTEQGRVLRGGAYMNAPWAVRPGYRLWAQPDALGYGHGFRCVSPTTN